jgi:hypothetical protein
VKGGKGGKGGDDNNKSNKSSSSSDGGGDGGSGSDGSDGDTRSVGLAILLTYLFYMVVFHCLSNMPLGGLNRLFMVVNRLYI